MSKKGRGRVKRKEVQSDDGWTVITHGLASVSLNDKGKKEIDAGSLPTRTVEGLTAEKLLEDFRTLQDRWEDTLLAKQVKEILEKSGGDSGWGVEKAACIGIGSFIKDDNEDTKLGCFAQDPAFTPLDVEFLSLLSITVLESDLQSRITSQSFVYSPFVDWFLLLPVFLKSKDPVLYVGNEILDDYSVYAQTKEKKERLEECNEVGKKWTESREKVALREFEKHGNALNGMVVYWKNADQGVQEGRVLDEKPDGKI
ncbi:unnamed protein product [Alternaria alternata]